MTLDCCTPYLAPYPGGRAWTHSQSCAGPLRNQKVRRSERAIARAEHPAGADLPLGGQASFRAWLAHADDCACVDCAYVSHWMDRDDDREAVS